MSGDAHRPSDRRRSRGDEGSSYEREQKRQRREEKRARKEARGQRRAARASAASNSRPVDDGRALDDSGSSDRGEPAPDGDTFVWKKKNDLLRKQGIRLTAADEQRRKQEIRDDLERTKIRRAQREAERAEWDAEHAKLAREREQEQNADWHRAEDSFIGTQHFLRQAIRLRENRATDADALARNVRLDLLDVAADSRSPAEFLDDRVADGLSVEGVDELVEAVEHELDCVPDFPVEGDSTFFNRDLRVRWWTGVEKFLKELSRSLRERNRIQTVGGSNLHASVQRDVDDMLKEKKKGELEKMKDEISDRLKGGGGGDDNAIYGEVDFWVEALRSIHSRLARVELREMSDALAKERKHLRAARPNANSSGSRKRTADGQAGGPSTSTDDALLSSEMQKGLGADEEAFAEETAVPAKKAYVPEHLWNEKYRPRKPRYYNRVHTGYDWTKYNRTHYDHNNPPPKTVQGYKFNIFYPDLIDRSVTPKFSISKTDNPEVSIITFSAGPPYEDLAFKIVNRQWEQSHRRGYRCSFDRGVLCLWFNFQRYRYRR